MDWRIIYSLLIWVIVLLGCGSEGPSSSVDNKNLDFEYFNIPSYFESEASIRLQMSRHVRKKTYYNDISSDDTLMSQELAPDFKLMQAYDINKPALKDKYVIDTLEIDGEMRVYYVSEEPTADVENLMVSYGTENEVLWLTINGTNDGLISQVKHSLVYHANNGYKIERVQKIIGQDSSVLKIEVFY